MSRRNLFVCLARVCFIVGYLSILRLESRVYCLGLKLDIFDPTLGMKEYEALSFTLHETLSYPQDSLQILSYLPLKGI